MASPEINAVKFPTHKNSSIGSHFYVNANHNEHMLKKMIKIAF